MARTPALQLFAGPGALRLLAREGPQPALVRTIPAAAGGPKGLILGPLDRFVFGQWLAQSRQPVDLVGASIGAWRLATACLDDPVAALARFEQAYVHQHVAPPQGRRRPSPDQISAQFGANIRAFYADCIGQVLHHPRYRLHVLTARGRGLLAREQTWRTPLGYVGAFAANALRRRALGAWLERVVFSAPAPGGPAWPLPFATHDYRTRQVTLSEANFSPALQASCSIPFLLRSVTGIAGAPPGAYWDGGLTDYHLHLPYDASVLIANNDHAMRTQGGFDIKNPLAEGPRPGLVLYPHFQRAVVPGWLDKSLPWRHRPSPFLDHLLLLAPHPDWVRTLPNAKLPDRKDFMHYAHDLPGRVKAWTTATSASAQLADEFADWLARPDLSRVQAL